MQLPSRGRGWVQPVLLLVFLPLLWGGQQVPSTADRPIRVQVNLVQVPVRATDAKGQPFLNLTQQDFHVFEDGKEKEIAVFGRGTDPTHIALVIDVSDSTEPQLETLRQAAQGFVRRFDPDDQLSVYEVGPKVIRVCAFTKEKKRIDECIEALRPANDQPKLQKMEGVTVLKSQERGSGTLLYDGLLLIQQEFPADAYRRVVLVFTDSMDVGSSISFPELTAATLQGSAMLFAVMPVVDKEALAPGPLMNVQQRAVPQWALLFDLSKGSSELLPLFEETAREFLDELDEQADVWLVAYRGRLIPAVLPATQPNSDPEVRPLLPKEAKTLIAPVLSPGYVSRSRKKTAVEFRPDKVVILTDADETGLMALFGMLSIHPATHAILKPEDLQDPKARKSALRTIVRDPRGIFITSRHRVFALYERVQRSFEEMALDTGGTAFRIKKAGDLKDTYDRIAKQIRSSYTLGYYTDAKPGRHDIEVDVAPRTVHIESRRALIVN